MKAKQLMLILLITLMTGLASCSKDGTNPLPVIDDSGTHSNSTSTSNSDITYSFFDVASGFYESFVLHPDGTLETYYIHPGINGWYKSAGTYNFATDPAPPYGPILHIDITIVQANDVFQNAMNICGIQQAGDMNFSRPDQNTIQLPANTIALNADYILESVSGVTAPDVSAQPNVCP